MEENNVLKNVREVNFRTVSLSVVQGEVSF